MRRSALILLALLLPSLAIAQDKPPSRGDVIGVNTGIGPYYYGVSYALADVSKTMSAWVQTPWVGKAVECSFDKNGGLIIDESLQPPQAFARCYDGSQDYPLGLYPCTWEGDGDFHLEIGPPDWIGAKWGGTDGRALVPVTVRHTEGQGIKVVCTRSNPANRVRNVKLWQPGCEGQKSSFRPEFVRSLRGFSTLRFLKDAGTEASRIARWNDRAKVTDARWTGENGLPYEVQIELCNAVGADFHVTIPYNADDDFARKLARLTARNLSKGRKVYVEWYNELWNWGYWGSQDAVKRYAPGTDASTGNFFGVATTWMPYRARQVHAIWEEEFGGADRSRLVTVIGGMHGWPDVSAKLMEWAKGMAGSKPPCDALATGAYFYPTPDLITKEGAILPALATKADAELLDLLFADLAKAIAGPFRDQCLAHRKIADANGVSLIAYEAGQHLIGVDDQTRRLYLAANRDARMGGLYKQFLDVLIDSGYERIVLFQDICPPTQYGYFGLRESGETPLTISHKNRSRVEWQFDGSAPINPAVLRLPKPPGPPLIPADVPILTPTPIN